MQLGNINRVMIRVPNWVGDAVMAVPALKELRRIFAGAEITLVARPWVAGLFEDEGLADELVPVRDSQTLLGAATDFIGDARQLRRHRFDMAVLLQNAFGAALLARVAGAKTIAGYPTDARRPLLDIVVPFEPDYKQSHQVRYYLNIATHLERSLLGYHRVDLDGSEPELHVPDDKRRKARSMLKGEGIVSEPPHTSRILALNPGATNSRAKRWPAEKFASAADQLADQYGFETI